MFFEESVQKKTNHLYNKQLLGSYFPKIDYLIFIK